MPPLQFSRDIHTLGNKSSQWSINEFDFPALKSQGILLLGASHVGPNYKIIRNNPSYSNMNITISGRSEMLIDSEWKKITPGMAVLSPKGVLQGARSLPGARWEFCWICFTERAGHAPRIAVPAPTIIHTDPGPMAWALFSLQRELLQGRQKVILDPLLQLVNSYVQRITSLCPEENHLWKLWEKVGQSPEHPWTGDEMARLICCSTRHLLRVCKKETGRTLRQQITHIRLTKAASLLQDRRMKLNAIAGAIGFQDAFAFSKAFKRWSGVSPKAYRAAF